MLDEVEAVEADWLVALASVLLVDQLDHDEVSEATVLQDVLDIPIVLLVDLPTVLDDVLIVEIDWHELDCSSIDDVLTLVVVQDRLLNVRQLHDTEIHELDTVDAVVHELVWQLDVERLDAVTDDVDCAAVLLLVLSVESVEDVDSELALWVEVLLLDASSSCRPITYTPAVTSPMRLRRFRMSFVPTSTSKASVSGW